MLDQFIADAYSGPFLRKIERWFPPRIGDKVRFRYDSGLPDNRIRCLWITTIVEHMRHRLGFAPWATFARLDSRFSLAAAARARQMRSNLFLYHSYAWEAFTARYPHSPRKVLFQYHPHSDLERRILFEDSMKYQLSHYPYEDEAGQCVSDEFKRRNRDCWMHADLILCASTFTKQSLIEVGAKPTMCRIVPYGIETPDAPPEATVLNSFSVLFVGSGTQRKGLHHLLLAWQRAALPAHSQLTLVCRFIDPGLEALAHRTSRVRLVRGLGSDQLNSLYRTSTLLAMPSLVEGFGQVYLEALSQGCPVLGTPNTCLPDLGESSAVFQVEPGQMDQLISELERLGRVLPGDLGVRKKAQSCAARWPWVKFRQGIRAVLQFEPARSRPGMDKFV